VGCEGPWVGVGGFGFVWPIALHKQMVEIKCEELGLVVSWCERKEFYVDVAGAVILVDSPAQNDIQI